jgi:hypothetical protein
VTALRAPHRSPARHEADEEQHRRGRDEHDRVARRRAVDDRRKHAPRKQCGGGAERRADGQQPRRPREHGRQHLADAGADGDPDADLVRPPRDGVSDEAVEPHRREIRRLEHRDEDDRLARFGQ